MKQTVDSRFVIAVAAAFALCYASVIWTIGTAWTSNYLYSYGVAVPLISGYVIWTRFDKIRSLSHRPDYLLGPVTVLAGISLLLLGHVAAVEAIQQLSLVVTLVGCVLLVFGRDVFRATWFPILYLLLALPIWDAIIGRLQTPSQTLSARIAADLLRVSGIPAGHEGTLVLLPNLTLQVMRECSGVNQLISIVAMALPAAFLWLGTYLRRLTLVAIAVGLAYLSNGFRIALVGFLGYHKWSNGQLATLHLMEGLIVSVVGYALLFASLSLLSKLKYRGRRGNASSESISSTEPAISPGLRFASLNLLLPLVLLCAAIFQATFQPAEVGLIRTLNALPDQIDQWTADQKPPSQPNVRFPQADDAFMRAYRKASGERVWLYIGYQRSQRDGKELVVLQNEGPAVAMSQLTLPRVTDSVELNELTRADGRLQHGMVFWYDLNGRVVANRYQAKGYLLLDALTRGRTNGAVVMVGWEAPAGAQFHGLREDAIGFIKSLLPLLPQYIPS